MSDDYKLIPINEVKIGMYIKLDLSWFEHSFPTRSFKITSQNQINELLALNLKQIRYCPAKSDLSLMNASAQPAAASESEMPATESNKTPNEPPIQVYANIMEAKRARLEKLKQQREEIARCKEKFVHAANAVRGITRNIYHSPAETIQEAGKLVNNIAETFLSSDETVMHLIQQSEKEEVYFHVLNVSVLAMMIAHKMKCTEAQIKLVGMAGLFHDVGKAEIPDTILKKTEKLTKPEQNLFEMHTEYGRRIATNAGLPPIVIEVIAQHHEHLDGTGYPNKLKGDAIRMPTRIVTLANVYDNLCNHLDPAQSLSPHEALAHMYAKQRAQFDQAILATMIKNLGVYPPGSLVRLSNETIGLVVNVNLGQPLRPCVLIYDEEVPKEEAMILDLSDDTLELKITASVRAGALPKAILEYLSPRKRVNYFFDNQSKQSTPPNKPGG